MKLLIKVFFYILVVTPGIVSSQELDIRIFSDLEVKTVVFRLVSGKYDLVTEGSKELKVKKNNVIYFTVAHDSVSVWDLEKHIGVFKSIEFKGKARVNSFQIEPVFPEFKKRSYYGNVIVNSKQGGLFLINNVDLESYVSGVVESESGPRANEEYYKSQAIICRTYALDHLERHQDEGFNLCDGVHCQVYKSMSYQNYLIPEATFFTSGLVLADTSGHLITAAFHSNSGGETANSEDVWSSETSYLKAIKDSFSLSQRNSVWEKNISYTEWYNYLDTIGIDASQRLEHDELTFIQNTRNRFLYFKDDTIPVKKIRSDFGLRSAYFSMIPEADSILIKGKGYGHGVGLSQEGAMNMAKQGYNFRQIIHFYYSNVRILKLEELNLN